MSNVDLKIREPSDRLTLYQDGEPIATFTMGKWLIDIQGAWCDLGEVIESIDRVAAQLNQLRETQDATNIDPET